MYKISVQGMFSAAHRLTEYKGKCENLHGHNWHVEVEVQSAELDKSGMVIDFITLRALLGSVLKKLDHKYLNDIAPFKKKSPSSERIAEYIHTKLAPKIKKARLTSVSVWETPASRATYSEYPTLTCGE